MECDERLMPIEKRYSLREFSEITGIKKETLKYRDKNGILPAKWSITKRRYYTDEDVEKVRNGAVK